MTDIILAFSSPGGGEGGPSMVSSLVMILLIFLIFYLLLIRPQQKKQKQHQAMITSLRKGDKIVTNGGIYGVIADVKEQIVVLKISEDIKIELIKSAIATVIERK